MKKITFLLILVFMILGNILYSQSPPTPVWTKVFNPGGYNCYFRGLDINQNKLLVNGYASSGTSNSWTMRFNNINGNIEWEKNDSILSATPSYFQQVVLNNKNKVVSMIETVNNGPKYLIFRDQTSGNLLDSTQVSYSMMITNYGDSIIGLTGGNGSNAYIFDEHGNQKRTFSVIGQGETIYSRIPKICSDTLWVFGTCYNNGNKGFVQKMIITNGQILWRVNFPEIARVAGDIDYLGNSYVGFTVMDVGNTLKFQIVKLNSAGDTIWNKFNVPYSSENANKENWINDLSVNTLRNQVVLGAEIDKDSLSHTADKIGYIHIRNLNGDSLKSFKIIEFPNAKLNQVNCVEFDSNGFLYVLGRSYFQTDTTQAWLKKYDIITNIQNNGGKNLPEKYSLSQNYPNPFNPVTVIKFQVPTSKLVTLKVYDVLGKEVATLVNEKLSTGSYEIDWNASGYPSGVYFYKLSAGDFVDVKKMILVK